MLFSLAVDLIVLLHLGFILFALFGGFLLLKWRRLIWLHLPVVIWGSLVELVGWYCPLTPLEQSLRQAAGEGGYSGGFIEHYIVPLIYPVGLTRELQILFGCVVVFVNVVAYVLVLRQLNRKKNTL